MENIFELVQESLLANAEYNRHAITADDDVIYCEKEYQAEVIADLLEDCGYDVVHTAFDDDEEIWMVYLDG